jgi:peroxiredoxin
VFGLPGAYTRTCSSRHLPGYVTNAAALQAKGIDAVACLSVNDAFVMDAWGKEHGAAGKVTMLGDGSAEFTQAIGLDLDRTEAGMGIRSQRYSMVVENGIVSSRPANTAFPAPRRCWRSCRRDQKSPLPHRGRGCLKAQPEGG